MEQLILYLKGQHPITQAFLGTCFTWFMTSLGASMVLFFKGINRKFLDLMLGFAGGVMIAASFWSLLQPAIELSTGKTLPSWFPALFGFLLGGAFMRLIDMLLPHLHEGFAIEQAEGVRTSLRRTTLLVLAVVLHNFPEGLAVGVAFGAAAAGLPSATIIGAVALAVGIGIQNFPEGLAVSIPLRREGVSRWKSFFYGQFSGLVEIVAGVFGAALALLMQPLLPYALAFAAGAMIFVVIEDVIPEAQHFGNIDMATSGGMLGFAAMMLLEIGFG